MYQQQKILAVILARGGSKRLPRKNVIELAGKPMMAWSIESAKKSKYIDKVIVSSDDDEILGIGQEYGCMVIKRPEELASDTATTFDAIKHAIENVEKHDYIVLLQPTSPLRNEVHVDEAIELLGHKNADAIISVCEVEHSPLWTNILPEDKDMSSFIKEESKNKRSQDLGTFYRLNGAIYICKTDRLLEEKGFLIKDNIYAYVMDRSASVDIDESLDLKLAKVLMDDLSS